MGGNVERMCRLRNEYSILAGKTEGSGYFGDVSVG
jgi:hypothetical protein